MSARPYGDGMKAAGWLAALLCVTCFLLTAADRPRSDMIAAEADQAWRVVAATIDQPEAPAPVCLALPTAFFRTAEPLTRHAVGSAVLLSGLRILTYVRPLGGHAPPLMTA